VDEKTEGKWVKGHEFVHAKHEILCIMQWKQRHVESHHEMEFVPHHASDEKNPKTLMISMFIPCIFKQDFIYIYIDKRCQVRIPQHFHMKV
jgi:hypothetical protein